MRLMIHGAPVNRKGEPNDLVNRTFISTDLRFVPCLWPRWSNFGHLPMVSWSYRDTISYWSVDLQDNGCIDYIDSLWPVHPTCCMESGLVYRKTRQQNAK